LDDVLEQIVKRRWQRGVFAGGANQGRRPMAEELAHTTKFRGIVGLNSDDILNHKVGSCPQASTTSKYSHNRNTVIRLSLPAARVQFRQTFDHTEQNIPSN